MENLVDFMRGVLHMDHMFHMSYVLSLISPTEGEIKLCFKGELRVKVKSTNASELKYCC